MKKLLILITLLTGIGSVAQAGVDKQYQTWISDIVEDAMKTRTYWASDLSFWVENPGFSKFELESFGHQICGGTAHKTGFYVITFWHSLNNGGEIAKVKCSS